jgi:ABC-2 type transport system permease protein
LDQLTGLLWLRWKLELRALSRARETVVGLLFLLPGLLLLAGFGSLFVFFGLRNLEAVHPDWVLPLVSAAATVLGMFWALAPLLAGLALTETHDVTRLMHFPIRPRTLVLSSFLANLLQPSMLAIVPIAIAAALALARPIVVLPLTAFGIFLALVFLLASAQTAGLLLQGLGRNRRWHDVALFLGLGLSFLLSLGPALVFIGGGRVTSVVVRLLVARDLFALSPFAWGARAAVHGARGSLIAFGGYAAAAMAASAGLLALSSGLVERIHRSEVVASTGASRGRARVWLPGALGALIEKDLRAGWRDPTIRAGFFIGLAGPLVFLFFLSRGRGPWTGMPLLLLATFIGLSPLGANAFGLERRGMSLLMSFPIARWKILLAKNLGAILLRAPSVLTMLAGSVLLAPARFVPAVAVAALVTLTLSAGMDNYLSILFPMPAPPPGGNPYGAVSGGRGLGAAVVGTLLIGVVVALCAPFAFLVWLPVLLGSPALWAVTLPLALLGVAAVYTMLLIGAERLLLSREPELLERVLGESA